MERRENERFPVRQFHKSNKIYNPSPYKVLNISKTGCAIESQKALETLEGKLVFELPLPSKADHMTLAAKVVWKEHPDLDPGTPGYQYGLSFDEMDRVSKLILEAYLDFLRRDVHIAQLEKAWNKLRKVQERIEVLVACEERKNTSFLH